MQFHKMALAALMAAPMVCSARSASRRLEDKIDELKSFFDVMPLSMSLSSIPTTPTSGMPSSPPSGMPSTIPSGMPSAVPVAKPSSKPSTKPSIERTPVPSNVPTEAPATRKTGAPSSSPTPSPTNTPTSIPTSTASAPPTPLATLNPTSSPSKRPAFPPSQKPSQQPSSSPSSAPTLRCNATESARAASLSILVKSISTATDVDTPGTPQHLALDWLINHDSMFLCSDDPLVTQRYVMGVFYYSTRGNRWRECRAPTDFSDPVAIEQSNSECSIALPQGGSDGWLTPSSECNWGGLQCNEENLVTGIDFEQNGIAGTLPYEIQELSSLRFLLLEEGVLTGTIPPELGFVSSLEQIDLNFNLLSGSIPEELYNLNNLQQLDLNDNELRGSISTSISQLTRLTFFQIENNMITGTIPSQFGALTSLEVASMYNNELSGTMPQEVCGNLLPVGLLEVLTVDCQGAPNRPSPPLVVCDCCTGCF